MSEITTEACEARIRSEIARLDDLKAHEKTNAEYFERNVLLYSWLLQKKWLAVRYEELASLVGATSPELTRILSHVRPFLEESNEHALRLHKQAEAAVEKVFNDPSLNYLVLDLVPYFPNIRGYEFLEYLNALDVPSSMAFTSLVMNAFRYALPGVQIDIPFDDIPHIRIVTGSGFSEEWHFVLAVFPHVGMLSNDEVNALKGIISDVRDSLQQTYGYLETLVIAPGVDDGGRASMGRNRHVHFLWGLSSLRFFHLFHKLVQKHKDYLPLVVAAFPTMFDVEQATTIFSIRDAIQRHDKAIEDKKKEAR